MKCLFCGFNNSKVLDSRPADDGNTIRRRRECLECNKRFTTYEKVDTIPLMVIKKNSQREIFDTNKILMGLMKACEKRPVSLKQLEILVKEVEKDLLNSMNQEIKSELIGEMIMNKLQVLDEVAYVRFASVYREFKDVQTFLHELENLLILQKRK